MYICISIYLLPIRLYTILFLFFKICLQVFYNLSAYFLHMSTNFRYTLNIYAY